MGLTELMFRKKLVKITTQLPAVPGGVQFDASVSEGHNDQAEIVSHPVETGIDVSDHIRRLPRTLEISGVVTNTPIIFAASLQALSPKNSPVIGAATPSSDRVTAAYEKLREIMEAGALTRVETSLRTYSNMAIESLVARREAISGNILDIVVTFREVLLAFALSQDVPIPKEPEKHASEETNEGKKQKKEPSNKKKRKTSVIIDRWNALTGG